MKHNKIPQRDDVPASAEPQSYLNFRLDILSSDAMKEADKVYRRECGLDVRHLRILRLVGHNPAITFSQLAAETRFERALTSRIVTALVGKSLVRREPSGADARQYLLRLTPEGEAVRTHADVLATEMEELFTKPLTDGERATLLVCLDKLTTWFRQGGGLDSYVPSVNRGRQPRRPKRP